MSKINFDSDTLFSAVKRKNVKERKKVKRKTRIKNGKEKNT